MSDPEVDVIIPVHTAHRPIARAVASALDQTITPVRVTVVCHNTRPAEITRALGNLANQPSVRMLSVDDGIPSPAGPINAGLDAATAPFTALLDSDDTYDRGAIDAWRKVQQRDGSDVVIPMLRYQGGGSTRTPPTRPFRRRNLDGVRDRLAYRSRMHGLVSSLRFGDVRMTTGLQTGEDVIQGATIWYSKARISFAKYLPGYRIHLDGDERASAMPRPAVESLAFLDTALCESWLMTLTRDQRSAFAVKILRTHVMDVLSVALDQRPDPANLRVIADAVRRIDAIAPGARSNLSRHDVHILDSLAKPAPDVVALRAAVSVRTDYQRISNLFPADVRRVFSREAPFRFLTAVAFSP